MTVRALGYTDDGSIKTTTFTDNDKIASKDVYYVGKAVELGIVSGYPDNSFKPANAVQRSEASKMVSEMIKVKQQRPAEEVPVLNDFQADLVKQGNNYLKTAKIAKPLETYQKATVLVENPKTVADLKKNLDNLPVYDPNNAKRVQLPVMAEDLKDYYDTLPAQDMSKLQKPDTYKMASFDQVFTTLGLETIPQFQEGDYGNSNVRDLSLGVVRMDLFPEDCVLDTRKVSLMSEAILHKAGIFRYGCDTNLLMQPMFIETSPFFIMESSYGYAISNNVIVGKVAYRPQNIWHDPNKFRILAIEFYDPAFDGNIDYLTLNVRPDVFFSKYQFTNDYKTSVYRTKRFVTIVSKAPKFTVVQTKVYE